MSGANMTGTTVGYTVFGDLDLSRVKGLNTVHHEDPSTVGVDTIYMSKGKIPQKFLAGTGIPQSFIKHIPQLMVAVVPSPSKAVRRTR